MNEPKSQGVGRNIVVKVRGKEYEVTIESISARAADVRSPWNKEDELHIWLSFDRAKEHPVSTLGFGLALPFKIYGSGELFPIEKLLELIRVRAEQALEEFEQKADANRAYYKARDARQEELDSFVAQTANSLRENLSSPLKTGV